MSSNSFLFSSELVAFLLGGLVHFFIKNNRPRKTVLFNVMHVGLNFLMVELAIKILMNFYVTYAQELKPYIINIFCASAWLFHIGALCCLLIYIFNLSDVRANINSANNIFILVTILFYFGGLYLLKKGNMYSIEDGSFTLVYMWSYIEFVGFISTLGFFCYIIYARRHFPRPLFKYIATFVPLILILQVIQIMSPDTIFSGIVYMIPFVVLYFLYHNDPYAQVTGSRDSNSLDGYVENLFSNNLPHNLIYINGKITSYQEGWDHEDYSRMVWEFCRECEYISDKINIFKLADDELIIFYTIKNEKKRNEITDSIKTLLKNKFIEHENLISFLAIENRESDELDSIEKATEFTKYLIDKYSGKALHTWVKVTEEDYKAFAKYYKVKKALIDIDEKRDLNDPRVICYAQPIYCTVENRFRAAEALMRLEIDGEIISPLFFIPIAEKLNIIHTLSQIILNKVCRFVAENKEKYEFDAISVNCSMIEMSWVDAASDFKNILMAHNVKPELIRLEITESTTGENGQHKKLVYDNFKSLYDWGIQFYLDDYGTGYSNLSRVIDMRMHTVKFDKSLLYKAVEDKSVEGILDAMIKAFKEKGVYVLVEGVEDESQANYAKQLGFDVIQGFYYAAPEPIDNLKNYFNKK